MEIFQILLYPYFRYLNICESNKTSLCFFKDCTELRYRESSKYALMRIAA